MKGSKNPRTRPSVCHFSICFCVFLLHGRVLVAHGRSKNPSTHVENVCFSIMKCTFSCSPPGSCTSRSRPCSQQEPASLRPKDTNHNRNCACLVSVRAGVCENVYFGAMGGFLLQRYLASTRAYRHQTCAIPIVICKFWAEGGGSLLATRPAP